MASNSPALRVATQIHRLARQLPVLRRPLALAHSPRGRQAAGEAAVGHQRMAALAEVQLSIVEFVAASVISGASAALATAVTNIAASTDSNYVFPFTLVGFTTLAKAGAYECQLYGQIVTSSGTVAATLTPTLIAIQKLWRPC